ncbi:aminopeptidase N [Corynebacterium sp. zg-331]|uniref:aminopeptidase N n=1 Tax=unclassified Corynebacterium TaxID=2624378 RepID=UPI00128C0199|nr:MULTISPECIES: aminopeptidase N [unclassified Corynebacterium]MBC3185034.1 aminopeptidase N [Corynebacterium sp. zg-331]MPV51534.1 aminopeptidase N [Corynebacterium sp. zg331]
MSSINLTQEEARERADMVDVHHYDVILDLSDPDSGEFGSTTTIKFATHRSGDTFLDLRATRVEGVRLDGRDLRPSTHPDGAYHEENGIALTDLEAGEHTLRVVATCAYSRTGEGLHRFVDPADGRTYLYTQFETADAKRMFACFDQPDLKATYSLTVHTPDDWRVIGNAEQHTVRRDDRTLTHTSSVDYPLSTYLVAVCAGPYTEVRSTWTGQLTHHPETPTDQPREVTVPLGLYCRKSLAPHLDAQRLFRETKQGFDFYHRNFGFSYPFGKYDQIFVPEFNAGAMENAGCVTIRDEYVFTSPATHYRYERRADTILHELAHMWFGDLVTMRWWDDLWLNESFATWASAISQAEETEYHTAWVTFAAVEKAWAYSQDQLPTTHPISTDASDIETVNQNFDGITYAKGASVLKQLQAYVGRENFFAGVRRHFSAHAWGNATFDDLLHALEEASGRDLSDWAEQWLKTTGISRLRPSFEVEDGAYRSFRVIQEDLPRTHRVAVGLYSLIDGSVVRTRRMEIDLEGERTEVPELVSTPAADLVLVNDDDLTYCLMGLDEGSREFLLGNIERIGDPMARTLCWSAAWEAVRDGQMRPRDYVALVARGAASETELAVLEKILAQATTAVTSYADPSWARSEGRKVLCDLLLAGAQREDPAAALIFAHQLASAPLTEEAAQYLRGLYEDPATQTDLRWLALTSVIAHGGFPEANAARTAITELSAVDRTSAGAQAALRAQAAVPEESVKREIFEQLVAGEMSNLDSRAKMAGLTWVDSAPLLAQFNEEYFAVAPGVWEKLSSEMAQRTLIGLYPVWDATPEALDRADALIEAASSAGLRRVILENRDRVARIIRLRGVDAAPRES